MLNNTSWAHYVRDDLSRYRVSDKKNCNITKYMFGKFKIKRCNAMYIILCSLFI